MIFRSKNGISLGLTLGLSMATVTDTLACVGGGRDFTEAQMKSPATGKIGIVGRIVQRFPLEHERAAGRAIVVVVVSESYGRDAPKAGEEIYVLKPGGGTCIDIPTELGADVRAILQGKIGGPYALAW
jgi:hypothetical protein